MLGLGTIMGSRRSRLSDWHKVDSNSPSLSKPKHTLPRRLLRVALFLAFFALLAELGGYAVVWGLVGSRMSAEDVALIQAELVETSGRGQRRGRVGPPSLRREVLHPYLGYLAFPPNKPRLDDGAWINEASFYLPEAPIFDQSDALVIGITGGSVAGQFLQMGRKALAEELAAHPSFSGRELRFVGLAAGGYKQPQQLMALSYVLAMGGRLDILINIDGFNEVALHATSNARQGVAPIFPLHWYFRAVEDELLTTKLAAIDELRQRRKSRAEWALESVFGRTWLGRAGWLVADRWLERAVRNRERELSETNRVADILRGGPHLEEDALDDQVRVWREASVQLQRLAAANGIQYFHALQPNQYVEGSKVLTDEELEMAYKPDRELATGVVQGYPLLLEASRELEAASVRFLDLTPLFEDVDETIYVDDCCHMNELGNQFIAHAIAQFILSYTE